MARSARTKAAKKSAKPYHHGDLRRALLDEAVRTIQRDGIDQLTLRSVGQRLGVSRSALYRHFADKQSLLAAVGAEGFRELREALAGAWETDGRGRKGFTGMARAYVQFAVARPSYYRVMFGGFIESAAREDHFVAEAMAAFQVLVNALIELQGSGEIRRDDPVLMAHYVWALVHGMAMLIIDGQLSGAAEGEALQLYAADRAYASIRQAG